MSERDQYEAAIKKLGKTDSYTFDKHEDGSYELDVIHFGWKIWQSSVNRQGYKLVPLEPSREDEHRVAMAMIKPTGTIREVYKAIIGAIDE